MRERGIQFHLESCRQLTYFGITVAMNHPKDGFDWICYICAHLPRSLTSLYIGFRGLRHVFLANFDWTRIRDSLQALSLTHLVIAKDEPTCLVYTWRNDEMDAIEQKIGLDHISIGMSFFASILVVFSSGYEDFASVDDVGTCGRQSSDLTTLLSFD